MVSVTEITHHYLNSVGFAESSLLLCMQCGERGVIDRKVTGGTMSCFYTSVIIRIKKTKYKVFICELCRWWLVDFVTIGQSPVSSL